MEERLIRTRVEAIDEILGINFKVLGDGFIRVIDYMGSDSAIVQAARVSYGKGTKKLSEDEGLIRYLLRNDHTTPFEMCELKLHVRVPMDIWRQWIRHRTANVNEYSTRYSVAIDDKNKTGKDDWRLQSKNNKQGSSGYLDIEKGSYLSEKEREFHLFAKEVYEERLNFGIAREQARKDLPLSTFTEAYWKIDLHNLLHFLRLRMDLHAQFEIREYARIIGYEIVSKWVPLTWKAFVDYKINSLIFSENEKKLLKLIISGDLEKLKKEIEALKWLSSKDNKLIKSRELNEFELKLSELNLTLDL